MKQSIGLLATGRKKLDHPAPVLEFYTSPLFQKSVQYAKEHYDRFYFYNAKDGLLVPDQKLEPYDLSIKTFSIMEKKVWARKVIETFMQYESQEDVLVYLHGGKVYRDHLEPQLEQKGYEYTIPMKGLGIGQQLAWFDEQLGSSDPDK
ncbi:DUF6884 domain-containing protein [Pseudalkalibacillus salsuginis]|uniref:DUF6884 domain-containing protein n=1 Tax=Pseudalkalibacillus salsuginis TaxID=2910972 RepID=UPI001F3B5DB0|nr:DUF6884 domain-containing protein [Pseudalkalibacillus salsuginis]MCF6408850.1 hypothetical protein [Pseudalkalibacillus salsuginis]